jgi:hypothetical protein
MGSKESLTDWFTERNSHAKAQSRKEDANHLKSFFASLRLCVKLLLTLLVLPLRLRLRAPTFL